MAEPISRRRKGLTTAEENAAAFAMAKEIYRGHPLMIRKMRRLILEGKSMRLGKCDRCAERAPMEVGSGSGWGRLFRGGIVWDARLRRHSGLVEVAFAVRRFIRINCGNRSALGLA
jgi:hypothetical protein